MVFKINSKTELGEIIEKLKKGKLNQTNKASDHVKFAGIKFENKEKENQKYDWLNKHLTINFQGQNYDIKTPNLTGKLIHATRPILEKQFNQGFLKQQSITNAYKHELQTITNLNQRGVFTPEINFELNKNRDNVIITKQLNNTTALIDLIKTFQKEKKGLDLKDLICGAFDKLYQIHNKDIVWGDAWPGAFQVNNETKEFIPTSFSFCASEKLNKFDSFAKDFMHLYFTIINRTNLKPVTILDIACETYISKKNRLEAHNIKNSLRNEANREAKFDCGLFYKPIFGINYKEVNKARFELKKKLN